MRATDAPTGASGEVVVSHRSRPRSRRGLTLALLAVVLLVAALAVVVPVVTR